MKIKYSDQKSEISAKTQRLIAHLIETSHQLAYEYGAKTPINLKCLPFCPLRCENVAEAHWYDNEGWKRLLNYPEKFVHNDQCRECRFLICRRIVQRIDLFC